MDRIISLLLKAAGGGLEGCIALRTRLLTVCCDKNILRPVVSRFFHSDCVFLQTIGQESGHELLVITTAFFRKKIAFIVIVID